MNFHQLKNIIVEADIVGEEGISFPLHTKLNEKLDYIIINGAESEPLLYVDQTLIEHYPKELLEALDIIVQATGAKTGIIGLKNQDKKAIQSLELANSKYKNIKTHQLANIYPAGDPVSLIYECTGRVVPMGIRPIEKNVAVLDVETLLSVWEAIFKKESVTHTYITIAGHVPRAITVKVPIGTSARQVIKLAGRDDLENHTIIKGGPMTGYIIAPSQEVTKTTKGLLVLEDHHSVVKGKEPANMNSLKRIMSACSQCRICTDLCPRHLLGHEVEPHRLMNGVANGLMNHSEACQTALGCIGCNLCTMYSCPNQLDPAGFMMKIKYELIGQGVTVPRQEESIAKQSLAYHQVPMKRLIRKLGLTKYDIEAPLVERGM